MAALSPPTSIVYHTTVNIFKQLQAMKKGSKSGTSDEDRALWQHVTRSVRAYEKKRASAEATPRNAAPAKTKKPDKITAALAAAKPMEARPVAKTSLPVPRPAPPMQDGGTAKDLKKKKWPIDKTIDLHGMTQTAAHDALVRFFNLARRQEKRTLLVITGKGSRLQGGGVLRRLLPLWLAEAPFAPHVLAITAARTEDGGDGAFYVRLKKPTTRK